MNSDNHDYWDTVENGWDLIWGFIPAILGLVVIIIAFPVYLIGKLK